MFGFKEETLLKVFSLVEEVKRYLSFLPLGIYLVFYIVFYLVFAAMVLNKSLEVFAIFVGLVLILHFEKGCLVPR